MSSIENINPKYLPKITVIVPVYNQEKYIGRCLRSLLDQTLGHDEYEILVINDGSADLTGYALELFSDPFDSVIRVIENKKNIGLPASINIALKNAKASHVVRVDSDDFVNKNFLNFLFYYLEVNDKADAVSCDYYLIDDQEKLLRRCNSSKEPIACGIMFKKEQLFEIGLYDESFLSNEEKELRIRFESNYTIERLQLPLYRYRRHKNNMTNDNEKMKLHSEKLKLKHGKNFTD